MLILPIAYRAAQIYKVDFKYLLVSNFIFQFFRLCCSYSVAKAAKTWKKNITVGQTRTNMNLIVAID